MTAFQSRSLFAAALFLLLAFATLAFGAVERWALMVFEVGAFATAAAWALWAAYGRQRILGNPFYPPLGLLTIWTGLQYALGLTVYRYNTAAEGLKWLALLAVFGVAGQVFSDLSIRRTFGRAMVWFVFGLCVFGLIQNFTSGGLLYWSVRPPVGRVFGPFVNANHFAALLELVLPTAVLLVLYEEDKRLIYAGVLGMMLAAAAVCASRAGIVLVAAEAAVILAAKIPGRAKGRRRAGRLAPAAVSLAALAAFSAVVLRSEALFSRFREEQPYAARWAVARASWKLFLARPWTGFGAGTFQHVYPSAAPADTGLFWPHAHNDPVQFAMEWGIVGPICFIWLLALLLSRRWTRDQWLRAALPVIAVLVHSWFDFPLQIPAVACAWLLTLAMLPAGASPGEASRAL